jgi:hypothetical protein
MRVVVVERVNGCLLDPVGRIEVRLPDLHVNDPTAGSLELTRAS